MIIDERMSAFIDSLDSGNPAWLNEIEKFALETQVPIIRRSMQSLLKFLLKFTKPKSILEVGTAIGFSALLMSEYAPGDCHITTIEKYEKRIPIAKENFRKAGREDRITLLNTELSLRTDGKNINRVYLAPDRKELPFELKDGYCKVTVPEITGYALIVFE